MWFFLLSLLLVTNTVIGVRPFYIVAHMTNTLTAVDWAIEQGANAIELDLHFNENGYTEYFKHGGGLVCDCFCSFLSKDHVCSVLDGCDASQNVTQMLNYLATKPKLALIIIDTKISGASPETVQSQSGKNIVKLLDTELFGKGYQGKVIISAAFTDALVYISEAAKQAKLTYFGYNIYFTFDQQGNNAVNAACVIKTLTSIGSKNIVFGAGLTSCVPVTFNDAILTGTRNRDAKTISLVYVWSIDWKVLMRNYIDKGVDAIVTNNPKFLFEVVREKGLTLADPNNKLIAATNNIVIGSEKCV
jgi:glycerophosphoryl diester phosphodiesterase